MRKKIFTVLILGIFASFMLFMAPAYAINEIVIDPSIIKVGQSVTITITVTSDDPNVDILGVTGTVKVTDPNGNPWISSIPISLGLGGGTQSWIYPDDFPAGASTNTVGVYYVVADLTITIQLPSEVIDTWITQSAGVFIVEEYIVGGEFMSIDILSVFLSHYWFLIILLIPLAFLLYKSKYSLLSRLNISTLIFHFFRLTIKKFLRTYWSKINR